MVRTRGNRRRAHSSYVRHRKSSHCHKKGRATCRTTAGCKYTTGKREYCRKSRNTHARTFRHKQRGGTTCGSTIETLPSGRNNALPGASSIYNSLSSIKGGRRRRKHHSRRHHSRRHHSRRHRSKRHHSRRHHSKRHHSKRHHSKRHHSKRHRSRRRRGGNPAFLNPAVLLAAQKLVQHNGLGL
jgi:hypothetical protein